MEAKGWISRREGRGRRGRGRGREEEGEGEEKEREGGRKKGGKTHLPAGY